jgi:hypothetical protein
MMARIRVTEERVSPMRLKMAVFIIASVITASSLVCAETIAANAWPPAHSIAKLPPEKSHLDAPETQCLD